MTRQTFKMLMNALQEQDEIDRKFSDSLSDNLIDFQGFYNNDILKEAIISLIKLDYPDINENDEFPSFSDIDYFIYDLDFGKDWSPGMITEEIDGKVIDIDLSDVEKFYTYLELKKYAR